MCQNSLLKDAQFIIRANCLYDYIQKASTCTLKRKESKTHISRLLVSQKLLKVTHKLFTLAAPMLSTTTKNSTFLSSTTRKKMPFLSCQQHHWSLSNYKKTSRESNIFNYLALLPLSWCTWSSTCLKSTMFCSIQEQNTQLINSARRRVFLRIKFSTSTDK